MRFRLLVGGTRAGLDQIVQILFEIVDESELYKNVQNGRLLVFDEAYLHVAQKNVRNPVAFFRRAHFKFGHH